METLMIGWTTVSSEAEATQLAQALLKEKLAACIQVSGPIRSIYSWQGKTEEAKEYRVSIKFLENKALALKSWLSKHHPYTTPQWIAVRADDTDNKYLKWAHDCCDQPNYPVD